MAQSLSYLEALRLPLGSRVKCLYSKDKLIPGAVYIVQGIRETEDRGVMFSLAMHAKEYPAGYFSHVQWADEKPEPQPPSRTKLLDAYYRTVECGIF